MSLSITATMTTATSTTVTTLSIHYLFHSAPLPLAIDSTCVIFVICFYSFEYREDIWYSMVGALPIMFKACVRELGDDNPL